MTIQHFVYIHQTCWPCPSDIAILAAKNKKSMDSIRHEMCALLPLKLQLET